jgi:hypothetical protein
MTPTVTLVSQSAVKWPRYQIQLEPGLTFKAASRLASAALRTEPHEIVVLSQYRYDANTGVFDTRVQRR